ncbi:hypothetical protein ADK76_25760 [Streptomyces griseoflavus]|nr:hypothetical protein ADK76_25760 [Streptomyces griseoflavus]
MVPRSLASTTGRCPGTGRPVRAWAWSRWGGAGFGAQGVGRGFGAVADGADGGVEAAEAGQVVLVQARGGVAGETVGVLGRDIEEGLGAGVGAEGFFEVVGELAEVLVGQGER